MEEEQGIASVRDQLIFAGIAELETHGIADFSLRRVAAACNLSCAAPYKHFKSKDALIAAIFSYIREQQRLLQEQVLKIYAGNPEKQLVEMAVAYIRFWIANPNFRSVLMMAGNRMRISDEAQERLNAYCEARRWDAAERQRKNYVIRSLIYGATILLDSGELPNNEETIAFIRRTIQKELTA